VVCVLGEEAGFIGIAAVVVLFFLFLLVCLLLVRRFKSAPAAAAFAGLAALLSVGALVNMGVALGLVPATGITLPFFSYGGSSLLASLITLGLLWGLIRNQKTARRR